MSLNYSERLIQSAKIVSNIKSLPMGRVPTNERQTRPLTKLEPELQKEAWAKAIETAPKGKITARHVSAVVEEIKNEKVKKIVKKCFGKGPRPFPDA
jgi:thioesterase domain-containing protein